MKRTVFTVGHSRHSASTFLSLLERHGVNAVADVRSSPFSRFAPQFNQEDLKSLLKQNGLAYVFLGRELGGRPHDRAVYRNNQVDYELVEETGWFQAGIDRIATGAETHTIALLCAERDPINCHRALLVGNAVEKRGLPVSHILPDGSVETTSMMLRRLARVLNLPVDDFFAEEISVMDKARRLQSGRVAFRDETEEGE